MSLIIITLCSWGERLQLMSFLVAVINEYTVSYRSVVCVYVIDEKQKTVNARRKNYSELLMNTTLKVFY